MKLCLSKTGCHLRAAAQVPSPRRRQYRPERGQRPAGLRALPVPQLPGTPGTVLLCRLRSCHYPFVEKRPPLARKLPFEVCSFSWAVAPALGDGLGPKLTRLS